MNATAKFYTGLVLGLVLVVAIAFALGYRSGYHAGAAHAHRMTHAPA